MSTSGIVNKVDLANIGLLLFSCILAFIVPFELFLFAYGVLGPLHYLTEISWLHDKNYYSTSKKDVILLLVISLFLTLIFLLGKHNPQLLNHYIENENVSKVIGHLTFLSFASALFFAFIKNPTIKIVGIILAAMLTFVSNYFIVFFTIFLPTLVHVFLFTSIFMLYGALKNKSKMGYLSVLLHLAIPFALFYLFPNMSGSTAMGKELYAKSDFDGLNKFLLFEYFRPDNLTEITPEKIIALAYQSKIGIAIMRFIAFAYMYHYLNWFSKTEIIRWHKVPKARFAMVIVLWIVSIVLYSIDYSLGFQWLFLLSFMHVLLEFPLNYVSFVGVFKELTSPSSKAMKSA